MLRLPLFGSLDGTRIVTGQLIEVIPSYCGGKHYTTFVVETACREVHRGITPGYNTTFSDGMFVQMALGRRKIFEHERASLRLLSDEETSAYVKEAEEFWSGIPEDEKLSTRKYALSVMRGLVGQEIEVLYNDGRPKTVIGRVQAAKYDEIWVVYGSGFFSIPWGDGGSRGIKSIKTGAGLVYRNNDLPFLNHVYVVPTEEGVAVVIGGEELEDDIAASGSMISKKPVWALPTLHELHAYLNRSFGITSSVSAIVSSHRGHEVRKPEEAGEERHVGWYVPLKEGQLTKP